MATDFPMPIHPWTARARIEREERAAHTRFLRIARVPIVAISLLFGLANFMKFASDVVFIKLFAGGAAFEFWWDQQATMFGGAEKAHAAIRLSIANFAKGVAAGLAVALVLRGLAWTGLLGVHVVRED